MENGFPVPGSTYGNRPGRQTLAAIRHWIAAIAIAVCAVTAAPQDKDSFTPMPLDSGFGRMDLSDPPIPPEQIIKEFSAKETEFQEALYHYTYRRDGTRANG